jgi:hypothetical protein
MIRTIALWSALLVAASLHAQRNATLIVHFASASASIGPEDERKLKALCARLDTSSISAVKLVGHTDSRGDIMFNKLLSERRAHAVAKVLSGTCLHRVPLMVNEVGAREPAAVGCTPADHAQNRRVEVFLEFEDTSEGWGYTILRHPKVDPLMPEAEPQHEFFQVDPSLPIELVASDGVRIRIAAGAIVDQQGNDINGAVEISYRSFNDPWAIIASGIPMHVGDREDAGHMESLGMYEVYASQQGTPLSLREGEVISLTKPTMEQRSSGYLDWTLDTTTGAWVEQRQVVTSTGSQPVEVNSAGPSSSARYSYVNAIRRLPMLPDSTVFLDRLASASYCHTEPCGSAVKPFEYEDGRYVSPYSSKAIPAIEVIAEKGVYRGQRVTGFRIKLRNTSSHTEWRAFPTNRIWAYNGPLTKRRFTEKIARRHFYQDIALEVSADGQRGVLRLKDRGSWLELPLDLTYHQGTTTDAEAFRDELIAYRGRFEAKRTRFDRRLNEKLVAAEQDIERGKERAWNAARRMMNDTELAMTAVEFDTYAMNSAFAQIQTTNFADASPSSQVALSFSMRGFGIYNCDQILRREAIEPQQVAVLDGDGNYFPWITAYGVLEGRRTVITYWGDGTGTGRSMRLSTDMSSLLFVNADGDLLLVNEPGSLLRSGKVTLQGVPQPSPQSPEELRTLASNP